MFCDTVEIPMKKYLKGEYDVDPIMSNFDDAIELMIFKPKKCPIKIDKITMMKQLGMVYSEELLMLHK